MKLRIVITPGHYWSSLPCVTEHIADRTGEDGIITEAVALKYILS
jgi:hypothetical protein